MLFKASIISYICALLSFTVVYYFESKQLPHYLPDRSRNLPERSRKLLPLTYKPFPLGTVRPTSGSWLDRELQNSANGLAGHLWDFYAFVKDSSWLGGDPSRGEYSGLNEGFPYWFNGLVSLAYIIPDARLKAQVHAAVEFVLEAQASDGWLGPETLQSGKRLLWGRFPFLLGLTSLVEANATAWERRVMPALWKFTELARDMLVDGGKGYIFQGSKDVFHEKDYSYGRVRMADFLLTLQWLLERNPEPKQEEMLWDCMNRLYQMSLKWEAWYNNATYIKEDLYCVPDSLTEPNRAYEHGVNIAQGLKAPAAICRFTHNDSLRETAYRGVDWTSKYHGAESGTILADERINGLAPHYGSELCTTVEMIFSLGYLYHFFGRNQDADQTERLAFNALPTMLTDNHWAHQYLCQPNQPWSKNLGTSPFFDTNNQSQTFGLEPHYPCCTVNHPQGLPKFLAASWARVGDKGIAHVLLSPGTVHIDMVTIKCHTDYPFTEKLQYEINAKEAFTLYLRVPNWAISHQIVDKDHPSKTLGSFNRSTNLAEIPVEAGLSNIIFTLNATVKIEHRANDTVAIHRGALLYALEVNYTSHDTRPQAYNQTAYPTSYVIPPEARDWTFTNKSAWNIAIDPSTIKFHRKAAPKLPTLTWAAGASPNYITAKGCAIDWPLFKNAVPGPPLPLEDRVCLEDPKDPVQVHLVPLGNAKLHMSEIPTIDLSSRERIGHKMVRSNLASQ